MAPGRIELLGNHLDYNGGPVLAAAIDRYVAVAQSNDGQSVRMSSTSTATDAPVLLDSNVLRNWTNSQAPPTTNDYGRGVVATIANHPSLRLREPSALAIAGNIPMGLGLSSSAALCVAMTLSLTQDATSDRALVLAAQEAEHRAGTPCGTMDQSTSVAGGAIRFDGATLEISRLDPDLGNYLFAVADSGVERNLGASSYSLRVAETQQARSEVSRSLGREIRHLAEIDADELAGMSRPSYGLDPIIAKRVRHVVTETARVVDGHAALETADWQRFGELMIASGRSSATDYEISHPRVEELVAEAIRATGVLGARMMGGGEGGAVLVLIHRDAMEEFRATLLRGYYRRHNMDDRRDMIEECIFSRGAWVDPFEDRGPDT